MDSDTQQSVEVRNNGALTTTDHLESSQKQSALFILKILEIHRLPLSTMETLIPDITVLVGHTVSQVQERLSEVLLSGETISEATIQSVCHAEAIINPFSGMETILINTLSTLKIIST